MNDKEFQSEGSLFSDPEPWASWETALVFCYIGTGIFHHGIVPPLVTN